VLEYCVLL